MASRIYSTKPLTGLLGGVRRTNNFIVSIDGLNGSDVSLELIIQKAFLPTVSLNVLELKHGNDALKFAGVATWAGGQITVLDVLSRNELDAVLTWFKSTYNWTDGTIGLASEYKKHGYIKEFAADGRYLRQWEIEGMWISSLDLGQLDSASGENKELAFTIEIDPLRKFAPTYGDTDGAYGDGVSNDLNN